MIKTYTRPTIKLQISAKTVVKITLVAMATRFAAHVISDVATPYVQGATDAIKARIEKTKKPDEEVEAKTDEEASQVTNQ